MQLILTKKWLFITILIVFIFNLELFNFYICCFSIKGLSSNTLKELNYKGVIFKCDQCVIDTEAYKAIDLFAADAIYNLQMQNHSFVKYFQKINNVLVPFPVNYPQAHPNFFIGSYNNLFFNYQFSHTQINKNFVNFSNSDLTGKEKPQFISNQLYIYASDLAQFFLNQNNLYKNVYNLNTNLNNAAKMQNYLNINNFRLQQIILNSINNYQK